MSSDTADGVGGRNRSVGGYSVGLEQMSDK